MSRELKEKKRNHKRWFKNKIGYGEKAKELVMKEMLKTLMMVDSRHGCARRF